jgi:hypothetical protein
VGIRGVDICHRRLGAERTLGRHDVVCPSPQSPLRSSALTTTKPARRSKAAASTGVGPKRMGTRADWNVPAVRGAGDVRDEPLNEEPPRRPENERPQTATNASDTFTAETYRTGGIGAMTAEG